MDRRRTATGPRSAQEEIGSAVRNDLIDGRAVCVEHAARARPQKTAGADLVDGGGADRQCGKEIDAMAPPGAR